MEDFILPAILVGFLLIGGIATWVKWPDIAKGLILSIFEGIFAFLANDRMSPELEEAKNDCIRSGKKWNHSKKRCEEPR